MPRTRLTACLASFLVLVTAPPADADAGTDMLMSLGGARWALIIRELNVHPAHNSQGAYSIAYLAETASGWTLERFWPELTFAGVSGAPGNSGEEVRRYGAAPLFFATDRWCGMDECSDAIVVTELASSGPVFLESVLGGAVFPYGATDADPDLESDCPPYALKARIGPPQSGSGLFSITYEGWTAPAHRLQPRSWFRSTTDYLLDGHALRMSPRIKVPDCAR
jgi:hypothetical protein